MDEGRDPGVLRRKSSRRCGGRIRGRGWPLGFWLALLGGYGCHLASLLAQVIKNPPAIWETWVLSLAWEDPRRGAWQPTPMFLSRKSPWTEEPGGLQRVGHN